MAINTIALPSPTEKTLLKMLARKSSPPRIITYPDGGSGNTAWVLSGGIECLVRMPVPPLFKLMEHQQPWKLVKNDWVPTDKFEWAGPFHDLAERVKFFDDAPWDVELDYSKILVEAGRHGLARILTDDTYYWTIQELFSQCAHLLGYPRWYRNSDRTYGNAIRATVDYMPEVPVGYMMGLVGFAPHVALGDKPLVNGPMHYALIEGGGKA